MSLLAPITGGKAADEVAMSVGGEMIFGNVQWSRTD